MRRALAVTLFALWMQPGGEAKRQVVNLEIPVQCVKSVTLKDCDLNVEPPKCVKSVVVYEPPSCPIIHIAKE